MVWAGMVWPVSGAQMQPGMQGGGEPGIARHDQSQATLPAKCGDGAAEGRAVGCGIMPVHHAAKTGGQGGDEGERVGQDGGIGKQPQGWVRVALPLLYLPSPGE